MSSFSILALKRPLASDCIIKPIPCEIDPVPLAVVPSKPMEPPFIYQIAAREPVVAVAPAPAATPVDEEILGGNTHKPNAPPELLPFIVVKLWAPAFVAPPLNVLSVRQPA